MLRIDVGKMQVRLEFGGHVKLRGVALKYGRHKLHAELSRAAKSERKHAIKSLLTRRGDFKW